MKKHLEDCRLKTVNYVKTAVNGRFKVHDTSLYGQKTVKPILCAFKIQEAGTVYGHYSEYLKLTYFNIILFSVISADDN
jgi:hypothetical protein